jgi:amidase
MSGTFDVVEASVSDIHESMRAGDLTCQKLVNSYLERIDAYDRSGPDLNAVITVNPRAQERAAEVDEEIDDTGLRGPLHGIPILVKDQAMTAGMRTTFGSEVLEDYVPDADATIISHLKEAGAIVLGKTNLPDWAAGDVGCSSVNGQTKNPYVLDRDPGGSSAGTGAAVAASLCTIGIGEDTGGSIRVPSAACNLFGIRVTTGLISRTGLSPLLVQQDTPGPMARTVDDMVRLLDALVGYDPTDSYTTANALTDTGRYLDTLDRRTIDNARIGVLRQAFGDESDPDCAAVNRCVESAIDSISDAGATIIDPVSIDELDAQLDETWLYGVASRHALNSFLSDLDGSPVSSFDELYESGAYYDGLQAIEAIIDGPADPSTSIEYWARIDAQTQLRRNILALFLTHDLDGIVFPDVKIPARRYEVLQNLEEGERRLLTNTYIASQSSCPAVSMPAGFTDEGVPVGIELLGKPYGERTLLSIAAGYEAHTRARQPPSTAPSVD